MLTYPFIGLPRLVIPPADEHTFWRFLSKLNPYNPDFIGVSELEFREVASGADLTSGETVIFGAQRSAFQAVKAFDNISQAGNNNAWGVELSVTDPADRWVGIQFSSAKSVVEYTVTARDDAFANQTPSDWDFQYSDDGVYMDNGPCGHR